MGGVDLLSVTLQTATEGKAKMFNVATDGTFDAMDRERFALASYRPINYTLSGNCEDNDAEDAMLNQCEHCYQMHSNNLLPSRTSK